MFKAPIRRLTVGPMLPRSFKAGTSTVSDRAVQDEEDVLWAISVISITSKSWENFGQQLESPPNVKPSYEGRRATIPTLPSGSVRGCLPRYTESRKLPMNAFAEAGNPGSLFIRKFSE